MEHIITATLLSIYHWIMYWLIMQLIEPCTQMRLLKHNNNTSKEHGNYIVSYIETWKAVIYKQNLLWNMILNNWLYHERIRLSQIKLISNTNNDRFICYVHNWFNIAGFIIKITTDKHQVYFWSMWQKNQQCVSIGYWNEKR